MKTIWHIMLLLAPALASAQTADVAAVESVIRDYIQGADEQDAARVAAALHDGAFHFTRLPNGAHSTVDKARYVAAIEARQIGGLPRELEILSVDVTGAIASAKVEAVQSKLRFVYYFALVTGDGGWKLVSVVSRVEPNG